MTKPFLRPGTAPFRKTVAFARGRTVGASVGASAGGPTWRIYVRNPAPRAHLRVVALRVRNFKAFGEPSKGSSRDVPMAPLTVFVGPNGAGKSTLLQAVHVLGALVRGNITQLLDGMGWDYRDLPHLRGVNKHIAFSVTFARGDDRIEWELELGTKRYQHVTIERVSLRQGDAAPITLLDRKGRTIVVSDERPSHPATKIVATHPQSWLSTLDRVQDALAHPTLLDLKAWAEGVHAFWSLDPRALRSASRSELEEIGPNGENLPGWVHRLRRSQPKVFSEFLARVQRHYPRLVDVETRMSNGERTLEVTEKWNGEQATFNARQVSDGLLRLMVIASVPHWAKQPSLILLDELENGMHPRLVGGISKVLVELSSDVQVVATTHSPITLNYVPADGARIVTRGRGGRVVVTPLMEAKNFVELSEHFDPGELWYNAGEERLARRG